MAAPPTEQPPRRSIFDSMRNEGIGLKAVTLAAKAVLPTFLVSPNVMRPYKNSPLYKNTLLKVASIGGATSEVVGLTFGAMVVLGTPAALPIAATLYGVGKVLSLWAEAKNDRILQKTQIN